MTAGGEGIIGVRVSVDKSRGASNYGFTLTRPGGWFDLLVNGGGAVSLQFQRSVACAHGYFSSASVVLNQYFSTKP